MKLKIAGFLVLLLLPGFSCAADDVETLFKKGLEQLVKNGYMGDLSSAERYLAAVLEREPNHVDASWLMVFTRFPSPNTRLADRASELMAIGPAFERVAKLAKEQKKQSLLHFMNAVYAEKYHAFERAVSEIEEALALEPNSARYWRMKGYILIHYGSSARRDAEIEKGIAAAKKAQELSKIYPNPYALEPDYDFQIASGLSELERPPWEEVVRYYLRYIEKSEASVSYAFAWNNISIAYRRLGQCDKAKDAAEKALKVMDFGAARSNRRFAEFCVEMQKMGVLTNQPKKGG